MPIMKKVFFILVFFLAFVSCKEKNDSQDETVVIEPEIIESPSLDGVWELVSFYNYEDEVVKDTVVNNVENRQVKMYLDGKVMWSRRAPADQIDYFGYGSYSITDSTLTEVLDYGSVAMLKVIDTMRVFNFELIFDKSTFSQIQLDPEGHRVFSENYIKIEDN